VFFGRALDFKKCIEEGMIYHSSLRINNLSKDKDNVKTRCLEGVKINGNNPIKLARLIYKG
jgi:hypothetical protein